MNILYGFEHQLLPNWAYTVPEFFNDLINNGEKTTLYRAARNVYEKQGVEFPFTEDDFSGFHTRLDVDTVAILMRFPQPQEAPLCYCAFIFMDTSTKQIAYYTLEKGIDPISGKDMQFLCSWDANKRHREHGSIYTDQTSLSDVLLIRFFYSIFRGLKGISLPAQMKEENDHSKVLKCPACGYEIIFNASDIKDGDGLLVFCEQCGRIYQLNYQNGEFLIVNKIN